MKGTYKKRTYVLVKLLFWSPRELKLFDKDTITSTRKSKIIYPTVSRKK